MNEIKVITELCAEDRARLDKLLEALAGIPAALDTVGTPFPATVAKAETENHSDFVEIKAPEVDLAPYVKDAEPALVEALAEPQHTKAELQQKVVSLVSAGKKTEVKEVIQKYAPKVSEVPEDKVDEVWNLLSELEG